MWAHTAEIVVLIGINVNGISDLDNIHGEASEGSPANKLKERDFDGYCSLLVHLTLETPEMFRQN
jgi:hypothetical protein